jgi:hypothetical protein
MQVVLTNSQHISSCWAQPNNYKGHWAQVPTQQSAGSLQENITNFIPKKTHIIFRGELFSGLVWCFLDPLPSSIVPLQRFQSDC